jgi:uncharacterized protein
VSLRNSAPLPQICQNESMLALIETKRGELEVLCRKRLVKRLALFGSAAGTRFDEGTSDLDFLVEFLPSATEQYADAYFGLQRDLEALFKRSVDLVESKPIRNPYFREAIEEAQISLYEFA